VGGEGGHQAGTLMAVWLILGAIVAGSVTYLVWSLSTDEQVPATEAFNQSDITRIDAGSTSIQELSFDDRFPVIEQHDLPPIKPQPKPRLWPWNEE
jgi:hypothetical protein